MVKSVKRILFFLVIYYEQCNGIFFFVPGNDPCWGGWKGKSCYVNTI